MPRSDRSSDDGSITSDEEHEDDQVLGATSPVAPQKPTTPWDHRTTPHMAIDTSRQAPPRKATRQETVTSIRSPTSPSRYQEALDNLPAAVAAGAPGKSDIPNKRFKAAALKVNRMRIIADEEPGIDPRSVKNGALYGHVRAQCSIEVVDYGAVRSKTTKLTNQELESHIAMRWINIGGVSWDVIKALSLRYNIHPLAIEDMLHNHQTYSSKADYYPKHLFIRLLCHTLAEDQNPPPVNATGSGIHIVPPTPTTYTHNPNFTAPPGEDTKFESVRTSGSFDAPEDRLKPKRQRTDPITNEEKSPSRPTMKSIASMALGGAQPWAGKHAYGEHLDPEGAWATSVYPDLKNGLPKQTSMFTRNYSTQMVGMFVTPSSNARQSTAQVTVNELKKGDRVEVNLRNLFIIMLRDGTLITIHQEPNNNFFAPIMNRLRQRDTLLRNSSDASMLLQNVLDLVIDNGVEVVEKYQQVLLQHERDILINPKVSTVRSLHIASGDIAMLKRTLSPLKTLIYGLRRYDLDRCIAVANPNKPGYDSKKVEGYLSHKSKIYLADVLDHMDYILASLDMFGTITENLISYTFNQVSYDMNTTVRTLTIMTVCPSSVKGFLTEYCEGDLLPSLSS
ncbi:hypothetical protein FRB96_001780 [Tulasnella sp. 330]|nr:hypothetical protein FRB96_001780 [Tulasnella sp. 330]